MVSPNHAKFDTLRSPRPPHMKVTVLWDVNYLANYTASRPRRQLSTGLVCCAKRDTDRRVAVESSDWFASIASGWKDPDVSLFRSGDAHNLAVP